MENLKKSRARAKAAITRIETFITNSEKNPRVDINEYSIREEFLAKAFENYCNIQDQIEDEDESQSDDRIEIESRYLTIAAKLKTIIGSLYNRGFENASSSSRSNPSFNQVNLPKVNLPTFSGKYDDWPAFIDLFTVSVDRNEHISSTQKFIYLKTHLTDEPLSIINEMRVTDENYEKALGLLKRRYDKKLVIINSHIKSLLDVQPVTNGNATNLRKFVAQVRQHVNSLETLEVPIEHWDLILIFILSHKLDIRTQQAFELEKDSNDQPKLEEFLEFLEKRSSALENVSHTTDVRNKPRVTHVANNLSNNNSKINLKCMFCKLENHTLYKCLKFKNCSDTEKRKFVQDNNLCFNCLGTRHTVINCNSIGCKVCGKKHHTFLHGISMLKKEYDTLKTSALASTTETNDTVSQTEESTAESSVASAVTKHPTLATQSNYSQILLATARVLLVANTGVKMEARALLDPASQTTFITSDLCKRLKVNGYRKIINIQGISDSTANTNLMVDLKIQSQLINNFNIEASCAVLDKITCPLPLSNINTHTLQIPSDLKLADPKFYVSSKIDMLIGADIFFDLITPGLIRLGQNLPTLQNTYLGWIIGGPIPNQTASVNLTVNLFSQTQTVEELIPKFWQLEEISSELVMSPEDKQCEEIFLKSVQRSETGTFQVDLPFKNEKDYLKLGDSYNFASRRFFALEKRFCHDQNLFVQYKKFIDEYVKLGHANYVPFKTTISENIHKYFLPHHCVIRESSSTTKLRVVFDASMKTTSGLSLNDIMLKGYTVQPELFDILIRFRTFMFAITADIQKMYRCIEINPQQRFLQNILWRDDPKGQLKCLQLNTVTYGTNSAPFLATRCLSYLAQNESVTYPLASKAILSQCYVDDFLTGANSVKEGTQLVDELKQMLESAGFHLHKWCSNNNLIINSIVDNKKASDMNLNETYNKVLGISWDFNSDNFHIFIPQLPSYKALTKRQVLSCIAQMFDPLGFIGPIVVTAKILMQKIWSSKIEWDEQLPSELQRMWDNFSKNLSKLSSLSVPRWILCSTPIQEIQLHGFSDAAKSAYGACLYVRVLYTDQSCSSRLLCSKSRIAPLKVISLPRLELCGAVLLARLFHKVHNAISLKFDKITLWTDSQIVLSWLNSDPCRWTTFVANRVSEIHELTTIATWKHISSADNPADLLSRGINAPDIKSSQLWWHGPKFFQTYNSNFEINPLPLPELIVIEEKKTTLVTQVASDRTLFISKFSRFSRLQRSFAYCLRFINNSKSKSNRLLGSLSVEELRYSLRQLVICVQETYFNREMTELKSKNSISQSNIQSLNPFIDEQGILRVGGRLNQADISFDQKHPMILPPKTHFTNLLIKHEHESLKHAGPQTVLANIRLRFWPLNGLREIKKVIRNCVVCYRFKTKPSQQVMGALPADRVSIVRPFLKVGLDFGGPIFIKQSKLRRSSTTKCYIALFVCMVTKAIHIELVSSLSTEVFLLTLKRFIARRGQPSVIYSDNATNFKGAHNQLKAVYEFLKLPSNRNAIQNFLTLRETEWKFIPPNSPHWGGLWEAGIKSAKFHIRRVVGKSNLTFEELSTILAQIEAILNSRPISSLSNDPSDFSCLTPGHFLIGESLTSYPERDVSHIPDNRLSFWQRCSSIQQHFWRRWSVEYLHRLQNRPKWAKAYPNLKENMIVLLREDNIPPLQWPIARIVEVMPGPDQKVRVVKVRTAHGIFIRPITKICPLPQSDMG